MKLTSTETRSVLLCLLAIIAAGIAGGALWALLVAAFCVLGERYITASAPGQHRAT